MEDVSVYAFHGVVELALLLAVLQPAQDNLLGCPGLQSGWLHPDLLELVVEI